MIKWKKKAASYKLFDYPLTKWRITLGIVAILFIGISLLMLLFQNLRTQSLIDQNIKNRWTKENDYAEVSVFFPVGAELKEESFLSAEHTIVNALKEVSLEAEGISQRIFVDCYYEMGEISVNNGSTNLTLTAYGVSRDFFLFHPLEFVSGMPIPSESLMRDLVVIDEKTAWDLFGATDVSGMELRIDGVPHMISGVIRRADDTLSELAGNGQSTIYVSTETLEKHGKSNGYMGYEICMPEPYGGFALDTVKKTFSDYEKTGDFVDNSKRYGYANLFTLIKNVKGRHMQTKTVIYPYWENVARYYDAHYANLCVIRMLLFVIAVGIVIFFIIDVWKHRTFHKQDVKEAVIRLVEERRKAKKKKEMFDLEEMEKMEK